MLRGSVAEVEVANAVRAVCSTATAHVTLFAGGMVQVRESSKRAGQPHDAPLYSRAAMPPPWPAQARHQPSPSQQQWVVLQRHHLVTITTSHGRSHRRGASSRVGKTCFFNTQLNSYDVCVQWQRCGGGSSSAGSPRKESSLQKAWLGGWSSAAWHGLGVASAWLLCGWWARCNQQ